MEKADGFYIELVLQGVGAAEARAKKILEHVAAIWELAMKTL